VRPSLPCVSNEANLRRAHERLAEIKARIAAGTFSLNEEFPNYRGPLRTRLPLTAASCSDIFDAFLVHGEARVARGDLENQHTGLSPLDPGVALFRVALRCDALIGDFHRYSL
jgi:hypothetical protein